jgi:hypothetical protein
MSKLKKNKKPAMLVQISAWGEGEGEEGGVVGCKFSHVSHLKIMISTH